jgi:ethanolamine ammonia-lyase small subunit
VLASRATTPAEHLLRPDRGRRLDPASRAELARIGTPGAQVQAVVGDGLSATAVRAQVPVLLPALHRLVTAHGWTWGTPFAVRHCRVGIVNEIGELLDPTVVVLLIGERPGLGVADSLSAYLAWQPRPGCTDADRNLVANIHDRGLPAAEAAGRIVAYLAALFAAGRGGVEVKDPSG